MELAVFISKIENLNYVKPEHNRLYFGNEFCQQLLPSLDALKAASDFALKREIGFSFVTPYVNDKGIDTLRILLRYIKKNCEPEIIINDWGVLKMLREEFDYSSFVLGRLLTKQKRGPRILNLKGKVPETMINHFKKSNVDTPEFIDFLRQNGIKRVELDNLLQGLARKKDSLNASLYFPYGYITTTRFCLASYCEKEKKFLRNIVHCNKECQNYTFKLQHKQMPVELILKGNTQFFRNEQLPENLEQLNIDRLVYQPEIPL